MWPGHNSTYRRVLKGVQTNAKHTPCLLQWPCATGRALTSDQWLAVHTSAMQQQQCESTAASTGKNCGGPAPCTRGPSTPQGLQSKWVQSNQKSNHTTGLTVQSKWVQSNGGKPHQCLDGWLHTQASLWQTRWSFPESEGKREKQNSRRTVSYTHLTLPTTERV